MTPKFTTAQLAAFLDEALPPADMAHIEQALRADPELVRAVAAINGRRDAGVHSVGEIWRGHRLSCPSREQLGSYLLGVLPQGEADYTKFHLQTVECRLCQANLDDLVRQNGEQATQADVRRKRYFQSSAGHLARTRD
jgi:hypothetical protein